MNFRSKVAVRSLKTLALSSGQKQQNNLKTSEAPIIETVRHNDLLYLDFVILPHGHGPHPVLGSQLLGEGSGHQASSDVRRG